MMQLMPKTAVELGSATPLTGSKHLRGNILFAPTLDRIRGTESWPWPPITGDGKCGKPPGEYPEETRNYILKVENLYHKFSTA